MGAFNSENNIEIKKSIDKDHLGSVCRKRKFFSRTPSTESSTENSFNRTPLFPLGRNKLHIFVKSEEDPVLVEKSP